MWATAVAAVIGVVLRGRPGLAKRVAALAGGVAIVGLSVAWHVHRVHGGEVARLAARHATADAVISLVRDPVQLPTGLLLVDATVRHVDDRGWREVDAPVLVFAHGAAWIGLLPGQRLRIAARFSPPRSRGDDVSAVLSPVTSPVLIGRPPWWQRAAGHAREALRDACVGLPDDPRGLLPSLVEGDTSKLPPALRGDMRVTGLSHLSAVSGANLGIVLAVALAALRGIGLRRRTRVIGAALAITGFVILARPSPSVQRAAVMSAVMLLAMFAGRRTAARSSLPVAVTLLATLDPFLARSVGFVLSVAATGGIVLLAPAWTKRLEAHLPRALALAVAVPAAAQLACTPVLILSFGQLTPYAVPANLLAGPAVVPATVLGVAAAVLAPLSSSLVPPLVWAGGLPTAVIAWVAHGFATFPGAATTVSAPWTIVLAALAGAVFVAAARRAVVAGSHDIL